MATNNSSVSGLSSGGYLAVQLHVAFSSTFTGVGVFAGGPFYCSEDTLTLALTACTTSPDLIDTQYLQEVARATEMTGTIDPLRHLQRGRVYIYAGVNDTVVDPGVASKLVDFYSPFLEDPARDLLHVADVLSEHCIPTFAWGEPCAYLGTPFLNNCAYDGVGEMLQWIYSGTLNPPPGRGSKEGEREERRNGGMLEAFDQRAFIDTPWLASAAGMMDTGYRYIPSGCVGNDTNNRQCRVHVALHGCEQTVDDIGMDFITHAGYTPWAEANDIIVIFPQAKAIPMTNPKGCWDWWGYTGVDYACNLAVQMRAVHSMTLATLAGQLQVL